MKRRAVVAILSAALIGGVLVGGCTPGTPKNAAQGTAGSTTTTFKPPQVGTPDVGPGGLADFVILGAASFSDGVAVWGIDTSKQSGGATAPRLMLMRPADGSSWDRSTVATVGAYANGATNVEATQVVVGQLPAQGPPGTPEHPFIAVATARSGGIFDIADMSDGLFGGKSAELQDVARTGDANDPAASFMAVGDVASDQNGEIGSPTGTRPAVFVSADGNRWQPTSGLPLPDGVTGAGAASVTYAPIGTAFPGMLVTGTGWATDPKMGRRTVAILWQSTNLGKSWKVVSGDDFNQEGRNLVSTYVAADKDTIVVGGMASTTGANAVDGQYGAMDWTITSDGKINRQIDTLKSGRVTATTALIARPAGGFLTTTQEHDVGSGPTGAGTQPQGNPVAHVWSSLDGLNWSEQTDTIKDIDTAMVIPGISEYGSRIVFAGMNAKNVAVTWTVDASTIK